MPDGPHRLHLESIDWPRVFPFLNLFRAFRIAVHPPKLLLALFMVVVLYAGGRLIDAVLGESVIGNEVEQYASGGPEAFDRWLEDQRLDARNTLASRARLADAQQTTIDWIEDEDTPLRDAYAKTVAAIDLAANLELKERKQRLAQQEKAVEEAKAALAEAQKGDDEFEMERAKAVLDLAEQDLKFARQQVEAFDEDRKELVESLDDYKPRGVFATALRFKLDTFESGVSAALNFSFGFGGLMHADQRTPDTVIGALWRLMVTLPSWMLQQHTLFMIVWLVFSLAVWSLLGGAIARMAATHAVTGRSTSAGSAIGFARSRYVWFVLTLLLPLLVIGIAYVLMAVVGMVYNVGLLLDGFASLLFPLALLGGLVVAVTTVLYLGGVHMLYPALAVQGTDGFDANTRCLGYVFNRPWRWAFYNLLTLVYGAVTYFFFAGIVFLTLLVTKHFVGAFVWAQTSTGVNRFDAMLPQPVFGELTYAPDWAHLSSWGQVSAALIMVWVYLLIGLVAAFAISFYFTSQTWIYLLLRKSADGTAMDDDLYEPPSDEPDATLPPDKVEPTGDAETDAAGDDEAEQQPT